MRIIHFSDSHLGYTAYRTIDPQGFNQRGEDLFNALKQVVDQIIELKPELALHTGDLFDSPRPQNRMVALAYQQLLRLKAARIPLILLSGNHDTPKQKSLGSVFSLFDVLDNKEHSSEDVQEIKPGGFYIVHRGRYEKFFYKDCFFHAVPHCENQKVFQEEVAKIKIVHGKKNVGMFHAGMTGVYEFRECDFNEQLLDSSFIEQQQFDYVALGHLHRMVEVKKGIWFSGSTERLSYNEVKQKKGFLEITLDPLQVKEHYVLVRSMQELELNDAAALSAAEVMERMEEDLAQINPQGKIVRYKVKNIRNEVYASLDFKKIKTFGAGAVHFEAVFKKEDQGQKVHNLDSSLSGLKEEFTQFIAVSAEQNAVLMDRGLAFLQLALEE